MAFDFVGCRILAWESGSCSGNLHIWYLTCGVSIEPRGPATLLELQWESLTDFFLWENHNLSITFAETLTALFLGAIDVT